MLFPSPLQQSSHTCFSNEVHLLHCPSLSFIVLHSFTFGVTSWSLVSLSRPSDWWSDVFNSFCLSVEALSMLHSECAAFLFPLIQRVRGVATSRNWAYLASTIYRMKFTCNGGSNRKMRVTYFFLAQNATVDSGCSHCTALPFFSPLLCLWRRELSSWCQKDSPLVLMLCNEVNIYWCSDCSVWFAQI